MNTPIVQYVNRAFADLSGYSRDEVLGKPAMDILRAFDHRTVSRYLIATLYYEL